MSDVDALSALLGERSDRQLRLLIAAAVTGPAFASPTAKMAGESDAEAILRISKGALDFADALIELDKQKRP